MSSADVLAVSPHSRGSDGGAAIVRRRGKQAPGPHRRLVCVLLAALLGNASPGLSAHGQWTDHYQDEKGMPCCHLAQDCQPYPVRMVVHQGEETVVEIAGHPVTLHRGAVHFSETVQTYWCARDFRLPPTREHTRCVFVVAGT